MPSHRASSTVGLGLGLLALLLSLVACGGDSNAAPKDCTPITGGKATLVAQNIQWNTQCLKVPAGTTVAFTVELKDVGVKHDLQVYGLGTKHQTDLQAGPVTQQLTVPFKDAGVYHFVCTIHANMEGTIYAT